MYIITINLYIVLPIRRIFKHCSSMLSVKVRKLSEMTIINENGRMMCTMCYMVDL